MISLSIFFIIDISTLRKGYIFNLHNREVFSVKIKRRKNGILCLLRIGHVINDIKEGIYNTYVKNSLLYKKKKYINNSCVYIEVCHWYCSKLKKIYIKNHQVFKSTMYKFNQTYKYLS